MKISFWTYFKGNQFFKNSGNREENKFLVSRKNINC